MPEFRRMDYVVGVPFQVNGLNSCPYCGHTNLNNTAHLERVDSQGNPFTYTLETPAGQLVDDGTFPTYFSWRCLDNDHSFMIPAFTPLPPYQGFTPTASGGQWAQF